MKSYIRDPFAVEPLPKAYYHPSPERKLSRTQRGTAISPSRQSRDQNHLPQHDKDRVSPVDEVFLQGTNSFQRRLLHQETPDDVDFDETWPTSLEEESPMDAGRFQATINRFANIKQTLKFAEQEEPDMKPRKIQVPGGTKKGKQDKHVKIKPSQKDEKLAGRKKLGRESNKVEKPTENDGKMSGSVLHRYIERFRNSAPMSREERELKKQSSSKDFWWLSSSQSDSPAPDQEDNEDQTCVSMPLTAENLHQYSEWEQRLNKPHGRHRYAESPSDKKTIELQERADKLLEKSSSTVLSTDPAVSTEGLGSNMSEMSSLNEYPYRPAFTTFTDRDPLTVRRAAGSRVPEFRPSVAHPEDDPLHQWRLRRKMDVAKTMPAKHTHNFDFLAKTEKEKMEDEQLQEFKRRLSGKSDPSQRVQVKSMQGEFTPAPNIPQTNEASLFSGNQGQQRPQIASPILHRNRPMSVPQREVDPHLHLVCDLLPCPHQQGSQDQRLLANQEGEFEHTENTDKFKQFLEAEKPDVDGSRYSSRDAENIKSDTDDRGNNISDNKYNRHSKSDRNTDKADTCVSNKHKTRVNNAHQEREDYDHANHQKTVRIQDNKDSVSVDQERSSRDRYKDSPDSGSINIDAKSKRREKLPKPRESSSPKPEKRGLDQAIGQVVKNHLFSMSTSTVLSSVESLPPVSSIEGPPLASRPPMASLPEQTETHTDESDQSDGEFAEDDLLQMLRKQRSLYEQQLQEIDHRLEKLEASDT